MDTTTTTAATNEAASRKALRLRMGKLESPITATRVLKKEQAHDFGGKKAVSWVAITPDGKLVKATTYGGDLGKDFNLGAHNTIPVPAADSKDMRKAVKGYTEVTDASQFPAFLVAATPASTGEQGQGEQGQPEGDGSEGESQE